jgi:hypothetical protein
MAQYQVRTMTTNPQDHKIRKAIDMLLSSDSVKVTEPVVKLTECSPDVDVVMNKQGGICTRCNTMFKSRASLINHIEQCFNGNEIISTIDDEYSGDEDEDNDTNESNISAPVVRLQIKPQQIPHQIQQQQFAQLQLNQQRTKHQSGPKLTILTL